MKSLRSLPSVIPAAAAATLIITVLVTGAYAQEGSEEALLENPDVTVQVAGLSCPFCAYGLEKKLRNLDGVSEVGVLLDEGEVQLKLEEGATLSEAQIEQATERAGFKAEDVTFPNEAARAPDPE